MCTTVRCRGNVYVARVLSTEALQATQALALHRLGTFVHIPAVRRSLSFQIGQIDRAARGRITYDDGVNARGTIFYDAGCGLCSAGVRRWQRVVERAGFELVPLQDPRAQQIFDLAPGELPTEIKLITSDGRVLGGVDAFAHVARFVWWGFPFHLIMRSEFFRLLMIEAYKPIARHRRRISSACGLRPMMS